MLQSKLRVRLRVRFGKALTTKEHSLTFKFAGRDVLLRAQIDEEPLDEAKWVLFTARGFETEDSARDFGDRLKRAIELAGVSTRIGINTGDDRPTTFIAEDFARQMGFIKEGERTAPNVHGLSIHPDDDLTRFPVVNATGVVTANPDDLLVALGELRDQSLDMGEARVGLRLLNLALMDQQPLSKLVLALSAVEALGQDEKWSDAQLALIKRVASEIESAASGNAEELEIADAMRRSLFRLSVRQGVKRVLARLDLTELQKDWDRLYGERSRIFHGTAALPEGEVHTLANDTVKLCGRIILALAAEQGVEVPSIAKRHYRTAS